jgi:pre-mRNA-processing factor 6
MTDLNSMKISTETEINDVKKARTLLKAIISSNPKNASAWISLSRVEELDGKLAEARNIINQACSQFM